VVGFDINTIRGLRCEARLCLSAVNTLTLEVWYCVYRVNSE